MQSDRDLTNVRAAQLHGRDVETLGAVESVAEGPAAIALSRGGSAKRYQHVDRNEDACSFAIGDGGVLIAVADGHHGEFGARLALERLAADFAPAACAREAPASDGRAWSDWLYGALRSVSRHIAEHAESQQLPVAPTTLALAVVRQHEGYWAWASAGDSHIFRVGANGAHEVTGANSRRYFLGNREETWHRKASVIGAEPLGDTAAVVLATDGLSESGIGVEDPSAAVSLAVEQARDVEPGRRSQWLAREVAEQANAAHRRRRSGDNIAAAVIGP